MNSLISFGSIVNLPDDPGVATYFTHLLKTRAYTDVMFILDNPDGETEFYAHKLILAIRSTHFADMLYGNGKEKEFQVVRLKRVNRKAFEDMIRYCYGCRPGMETTEEVCALFQVADEFNVMSLMNLCRTFLRGTNLDPGNVFTMLKVSEKMQDKSLKDMCYKLLEEQTRKIIESYDIRNITPFMVHTFLDLPRLDLYSEYELIKWLFEWGKVKAEERDENCDTARDYLQKLLLDINFLALTFEEFAKLCKDYPDFFNCEEIANIYLNIAFPGSREMPDWYDKEVKIRQYTGSRK